MINVEWHGSDTGYAVVGCYNRVSSLEPLSAWSLLLFTNLVINSSWPHTTNSVEEVRHELSMKKIARFPRILSSTVGGVRSSAPRLFSYSSQGDRFTRKLLALVESLPADCGTQTKMQSPSRSSPPRSLPVPVPMRYSSSCLSFPCPQLAGTGPAILRCWIDKVHNVCISRGEIMPLFSAKV